MKNLQHGDLIEVSGNREREYLRYKVAVASALHAEWNVASKRLGLRENTLGDKSDYAFATTLPTVLTAWREAAPVIAATVALGETISIRGLAGTYTVEPERNGNLKFVSTDPALAAKQAAERKAEDDLFYSKNSESYLSG